MFKKQFDHNLYRASDGPARSAAKKYWTAKGYSAADNQDKYGIDLIVGKDGEYFPVEVEVKMVWKGSKFPWTSIQIPQRKEKFAKLPSSIFMVFNADLMYAAIIRGTDIIASPKVKIDTKYTIAEEFFQIPIGKVEIVPV